jgi:hypothetical protein
MVDYSGGWKSGMKPACRDLRRLSPLTTNNTTYAQHSMATLTSTMEGLALDGSGEALITILWVSSFMGWLCASPL